MRKLILLSILMTLFSGCSKEPQTLEELRQAGEEAFLNQNYADARKYLSQVVAKKPSDRQLLYLLGVSYKRDYIYDSAFHYLKRADLLFPDDRETNLHLYEISSAIEEWNSAIRAIHVLIETGDPIEQYYNELATLNSMIKNHMVAYHFFQKLMEKEPDNPNYYLQTANMAAKIESLHVSLAVIDSAIERFGSDDEFLLNKGMYLAAKKSYDESELILRSLYAKDTSSFAFQLNLAHVLGSQDTRAKRQEALEMYIRLRPRVDDTFRIDSLIFILQEELNSSP